MLFDTLENRQMFSQAPIIDAGALADLGGNSPADAPGGTLVVGQKHAVTESIGAGDANDFHRISLDQDVTFKASMKARKGMAEPTLMNATGESVGQGKLKSVKGNLEAGDYFLKVHSDQDAQTNYSLSFQAKAAKKPGSNLLPGSRYEAPKAPTELPPINQAPPLGLPTRFGPTDLERTIAAGNEDYGALMGNVSQMSPFNIRARGFHVIGNRVISINAPSVESSRDSLSWLPVLFRWDAAQGAWSGPMYAQNGGVAAWISGDAAGSPSGVTWSESSYASYEDMRHSVQARPAEMQARLSVAESGYYAVGNYVYSHTTGQYRFELSNGSAGTYYEYVV